MKSKTEKSYWKVLEEGEEDGRIRGEERRGDRRDISEDREWGKDEEGEG